MLTPVQKSPPQAWNPSIWKIFGHNCNAVIFTNNFDYIEDHCLLSTLSSKAIFEELVYVKYFHVDKNYESFTTLKEA